MSKILVEIRVPAADKRRDVFIPFERPLYEITELVKAVFSEEAAQGFEPDAETVLCDAGSGQILDGDRTPEELGLLNGARLLLI
jgi:hypothetical protein